MGLFSLFQRKRRVAVAMMVESIEVRVIDTLASVQAAEWDALVGDHNPFVEYAFLNTLERSGSVGPGRGWEPAYVVAYRGSTLLGALPSYVKTDSYGEFIFDWGWAQAAHGAGIPYYPKLTVGVPYTPATGSRLLVHPSEDRDVIGVALLRGLAALRESVEASGMHVLFCRDDEAEFLEGAGFCRRATHQYHWRNDRYESFDAFLATLRSSGRKMIRKERRRVEESGVRVELRRGADIEPSLVRDLYRLYTSTIDRKWGSPYLTPKFFQMIPEHLGDRALFGLAWIDDELVAMTLSFEKGDHVYGRHWGSRAAIDCLHFEMCYYQLIDHAIKNGRTLVEAGAQGEHKMKRGFVPVQIHSAHRLSHPGLHAAVARFIVEERESVEDALPRIAAHTPFKKGAAPDLPQRAGIDLQTKAKSSCPATGDAPIDSK
ncbi:MAG: GNAT family N-acetyltransferase [Myxococcota bacterium]